ncbi:MAG TPA: peptidoglycan-binding domain-containing protein [Magnetospirillum sp.]|nr:peptidoglycan-binding domain-containing protein [Magnetospirillum sp.]
MSKFALKAPMGTNYRTEPSDILNTKQALNRLGYYDVPPGRGIDDWTDDAMFNGIRAFQKDNGLKVDGFMRPERPTETAINAKLGVGKWGRGAAWCRDVSVYTLRCLAWRRVLPHRLLAMPVKVTVP